MIGEFVRLDFTVGRPTSVLTNNAATDILMDVDNDFIYYYCCFRFQNKIALALKEINYFNIIFIRLLINNQFFSLEKKYCKKL